MSDNQDTHHIVIDSGLPEYLKERIKTLASEEGITTEVNTEPERTHILLSKLLERIHD